jgi:glucose-1-phosphate cytidylyltransferase
MNQPLKVVILAGGLGTRLGEETGRIPKPLVTIGEKPIIWHIMKIYSHYGFKEFVICLGYKGYLIKEYFANYFLHNSDVTLDYTDGKNKMIIHNKKTEDWKITLIDTGFDTQTGGRIKRIQPYVKDETFMLTYGDGVSDINIKELIKFHFKHGKTATVTAVQPPGKFGALKLEKKQRVKCFTEKPSGDKGWINGGFMVLNKEAFKYINEGDQTIWEKTPMENLASKDQLRALCHNGFWKCMDTLRDRNELISMWNEGKPPWKIWRD